MYCTSSTPCHAHHLALYDTRKGKVYAFQQSKRARAHLRFGSCRARLKQRLEAAQEGVSTEDGSSSVTSGLDEDQALQADIMMRRLVQVSIFIFLFYFHIVYLYFYSFFFCLVVVGQRYMAYANDCRHEFFVLQMLRPYPTRGALALVCAGKHAAAHFHSS